MSVPAAARLGDPIAHESLLSQIGQVGAGLLAGVAVGALFAGVAALGVAFVVGTGGLGAVVLGGIVAAGLQFGADKFFHAAGMPGPSDLPEIARHFVGGLLDQVFPPVVMGAIAQGSPNVFINGKPAARAVGEGGDNRVDCQRHGPTMHLAEGSKIVFINSAPAHRVGDRTDCAGKTTGGSGNVFVGGPPLQTREIASGMPWWLDLVDKYAGMALVLCTHDWKSGWGKLLCLGVSVVAPIATDWALTTLFGKPVHAPTGAKVLDGSADLDFAFPAHLPLRWVRTYNSMDTAEGPLGPGWRLPIAVTLTATGDGATLSDAQGIAIPFGAVGPGAATVNISYGWTLGRTGRGRWVARDPDGLFYDFGPDREGNDLPLQRMEDRNGNRVALHYDEAGRLAELVDSAGRLYACSYDPVHERRIGAVAWVKSRAERLVLVRYGYDAGGRLTSVTNRADDVVRRFTWHDAGPGRGLMASQTLPAGLVCHYEWASFAGSHPRVVRHTTSAGEEWRAAYEFDPDGRSGKTTVKDRLGRVQSWEWAGPYQVTAYNDAAGQTWRWRYNDAGLPVACTEPDGAIWSQSYDAHGNLVQAMDPLGGQHVTVWRDDLALPEAETGPDGAETRYEYDQVGNLLAVTHPGGRVEFDRDATGAMTAKRDESGKESRWERRADGQAAAYTDCSGKTTRWDYDGEGRFISMTDGAGQSTRYAWDDAGRIAGLLTPDGIRRGWRWTLGGYLAQASRAGAVTQYSWDQSGRLVGMTDPVGNTVRREYDGGGRLSALIDGGGQTTRFAYDAADRLMAETGIDRLRTEYRRNAHGLPVEVVRGAGTADAVTMALERDPMGRLVAKRTPESLTRYTYDPAGRVLAVTRFTPDGETLLDAIGFAYDKAGRLVEETTATHRFSQRIADGPGRPGTWQWAALPAPRRTVIRHERDALGNVIGTTLPHGPELRYLRYGSGHLLQINLGDIVVAEMTRDDLHREVSRRQGAIESRFRLDPMGRRLSYRAQLAEEPGFGTREFGPGATLAKDYRYDAQGLLVERSDTWLGRRRFSYDLAGRICANENAAPGGASRPIDEAFQWDGASNAVPFEPGLRVIAGETVQNRVVRWGSCVYEYDAHGRMTRKKTASGERIFLTWNSEHQLVRSWSGRGGDWIYHYDALGRRIAKQRHHDIRRSAETIWFVWDGMRVAQEESGPDCVTTVYEDAGRYVPLARVEQRRGEKGVRPEQIYHFHADINGAPEELTSHAGHVAWRARYRTWGNLALQESDHVSVHDPVSSRAQNLRFQGQYYDAETGLHYNTFRYYDPEIGRFASQDPIGLRGGTNLYRYAPDPLSWIDPWGLCSKDNRRSGRNSEGDAQPAGPSSSYVDTTGKNTLVPNRTTDVTAEDFGRTLEENGYTPTSTPDGRATTYTAPDGSSYTVRPSDSAPGGAAADYRPAGSRDATLKINLGP
jgi:RHS repeat-associated protein